MEASLGDRIVIEPNKVGGAQKSGEVIEVIEAPSGRHYRIRWQDGHESIVFPSSDAFVASHT